jgi:beta-lactamase class A
VDWSEIDAIAGEPGGEVSVLLADPATGRVFYAREADRVVRSASVIKTLILAALFREESLGRLSLAETLAPGPEDRVAYSLVSILENPRWSLGDLAVLMMTVSDNTATNLLIGRIGMDRINRVAEELGLERTRLRRKMMDFEAARRGLENRTCLSDVAALFGRLYNASWLDRERSDRAMAILGRQKDDSMLRRFFFEEECPVAHKSGLLEGVQNDAGIFGAEPEPYFLGVFVSGAREPEGKERIGRISRRIYDRRGEWSRG